MDSLDDLINQQIKLMKDADIKNALEICAEKISNQRTYDKKELAQIIYEHIQHKAVEKIIKEK